MGFAENDEVWQAFLATFRQALQDLGWTDGRNIRFDYRFTGESEERMRLMAEEIAGLAPDVILASTNSVVSATVSAQNRHVVAVAACRLLGDERTSIRNRLRSEFDPGRVETPFVPQKLERMGVVHVDVTV